MLASDDMKDGLIGKAASYPGMVNLADARLKTGFPGTREFFAFFAFGSVSEICDTFG